MYKSNLKQYTKPTSSNTHCIDQATSFITVCTRTTSRSSTSPASRHAASSHSACRESWVCFALLYNKDSMNGAGEGSTESFRDRAVERRGALWLHHLPRAAADCSVPLPPPAAPCPFSSSGMCVRVTSPKCVGCWYAWSEKRTARPTDRKRTSEVHAPNQHRGCCFLPPPKTVPTKNRTSKVYVTNRISPKSRQPALQLRNYGKLKGC